MDKNTFLERLTGALGRVGEAMAGLSAKLSGKVSAEKGKGLSANDFNGTYRQRLCRLLGYTPGNRKVNLQGDEEALFQEDRLTEIKLDV